MNPLEGLGQYLDRLERRLRYVTWSRGAAAITGAALLLTLAIVAATMGSPVSPSGLLLGRFVLFLGIGAAVALALIVPLTRMNRRRAAQEGEQKFPVFDQRLLTFTEKLRDNSGDPFLPLLAADALHVAQGAQPEQVVDNARIFRFASLAAIAAVALIWQTANTVAETTNVPLAVPASVGALRLAKSVSGSSTCKQRVAQLSPSVALRRRGGPVSRPVMPVSRFRSAGQGNSSTDRMAAVSSERG